MLLLALLPVALRLALLPHHPVPCARCVRRIRALIGRRYSAALSPGESAASVAPVLRDILCTADARVRVDLSHRPRPHAWPLGRAIFGLPWAGVLLSTAALCSLCYWMLRGWTTPEWALLGGVLAVMEFGPLSCVDGQLLGRRRWRPLPDAWYSARFRDCAHPSRAARFGASAGIRTRRCIGSRGRTKPFSWAWPRSCSWRHAGDRSPNPPSPRQSCCFQPIALSLLQNKQVTGSWTTLPYALSRYQYGVPAAFTWQENPQPHQELTREQQLQYKMQTSFRAQRTGNHSDLCCSGSTIASVSTASFFSRPLYVALPFFFCKLRDFRFLWVALTLAIFALGVNFYPFFEVHYLGALTCLFVLVSVTALARMNSDGRASDRLPVPCAFRVLV